MIIWRGWGALPILIAAAAAGLGALMSMSVPGLRGLFIGLALIGGAVGNWYLGQWLNLEKPRGEFDQWQAGRRSEVAAMVQGGHYSHVPDPQRPGQFADPWAVGEYVLKQESTKVRAALTNRHSLFFVPLQYLGFVMGGIGIVVMVVGLFR